MRRADRLAFTIAYAAWLFGILAFFIPAATWNPVSRFNLTRALVERGSLQVDPYVESTGDRSLVNGHWYSDKPPVVGVLAAPAYAVVRVAQRIRGVEPDFEAYGTEKTPALRVTPNQAFQQGLYVSSLFTSGIAGIAVALLAFELLKRRTTTRRAFLGSALAVLGTPILGYATSLYGHVPAAAFVLGAIVCLDTRGQRPPDGLPSPRRLRIAGACIGLTAGTEYLVAIPAALLAVWFLAITPGPARWRAFLNIAVGGAVPVLFVAGYHTAVFGAPWRTGYSFETQPEFVAGHAAGLMGIRLPHFEGLFGLTLSVRRGLFYVSPVLALGLVFLARTIWRHRDWALGAGLSVLLALLALNAGYYMWWGGAAAGPRHLIPGMAFLAAGIAFLPSYGRPWLGRIVVLVALASALNAFAIALVGVEAPERGDVLRDFAWARMGAGRIAAMNGASNLGLKVGLPAVGSVIPLLAWVAVGFAYLWRQLAQGDARTRFAPGMARVARRRLPPSEQRGTLPRRSRTATR
jgi:hypothetical protein